MKYSILWGLFIVVGMQGAANQANEVRLRYGEVPALWATPSYENKDKWIEDFHKNFDDLYKIIVCSESIRANDIFRIFYEFRYKYLNMQGTYVSCQEEPEGWKGFKEIAESWDGFNVPGMYVYAMFVHKYHPHITKYADVTKEKRKYIEDLLKKNFNRWTLDAMIQGLCAWAFYDFIREEHLEQLDKAWDRINYHRNRIISQELGSENRVIGLQRRALTGLPSRLRRNENREII